MREIVIIRLIARHGLFLLAALVLLALSGWALAQDEPALPLYALPDSRQFAYTSNTMALANDALTLAVVNSLNNSVTFVIPTRAQILGEVPVGLDPRSITLTLDGARAVTANRGDNTLSVIDAAARTLTGTIELGGALPYGVVTDNNQFVYVSMQGSDEVLVVDLNGGIVVERIPVVDAPAGLALWGDFLYVSHFWNGHVSLIYLPQRRVIDVISTGLDTGLSQSIEIDIARGIAYLPQTRSNAQNRTLIYDTTVFPVVNVLNLRDLSLQRQTRIALDTADRPVNMPFSAAVDRFREWLFVANAGTNDLTVIDLDTGLARAHIDVGQNPRGVLLNRDSTRVFVHNTLDGTLTVINANSLEVLDELPITDLLVPADILLGAQLFHNAGDPRVSARGWISCANCHFDGQSDGRVWMGFPDGPRNTPLLYGLPETAPYTWSGSWDEVADVELKIRGLQGGQGLIEGEVNAPMGDPHFGVSPDLDTLVAYLTAIQSPPSRPPMASAETLERGAAVFAAQGCAECHVGQVGTNLQAFDVGTGDSLLENAGQTFDTPSLRWLWLSAPYFHDGSAETLVDVFTMPGEHQLVGEVMPDDIQALVSYLLSLPNEIVP